MLDVMQDDLGKERLGKEHCVPCEGGMPPLPDEEAAALHTHLAGEWQLARSATSIYLDRNFRNFAEAFSFATRVALLAESEGHHPDLEIGWGKVRISLTTHAAGGLTRNDFVMAAKIDALKPN